MKSKAAGLVAFVAFIVLANALVAQARQEQPGTAASKPASAAATTPATAPASAPTATSRPSGGPFGHGTGITQQMKDLSWMVGKWTVTMTYYAPPPANKSIIRETEAVIESVLDGSFLQERITVPAGPNLDNHMVGMRSYDRFRKTYRVVWFDSVITLADVFEGPATDAGFVVSNAKTGTAGIFAGRDSLLRITQTAGASRDEFKVLWEVTGDKGQTWTRSAEYVYKRK